jgi:hypothetical protein
MTSFFPLQLSWLNSALSPTQRPKHSLAYQDPLGEQTGLNAIGQPQELDPIFKSICSLKGTGRGILVALKALPQGPASVTPEHLA